MIKIALWEPSAQLMNNVKKLSQKTHCIMGVFTDDEKRCKNNPGWKFYTKKEPRVFDIMLIDIEDFRNMREKLMKKYDIREDQIHTFEEYWVLGCEETVQKQYHDYWSQLEQAGILLFQGKTVLIFGGGSGIGKESARAFLKAGANVIIAGRTMKKLTSVQAEFATDFLKCLRWDITKISQNQSRLQEAEKLFGKPIDIVVNSAGVWTHSTFYEVTEEEYDKCLDTNLKGVYFICQLFAQYFIKHQIRGHIVNVISNVGTLPTVKPYGISKWGGIGLTKGLGQELAQYGIIVNGVAPGGIATEMAGWHEGDCPARRASRIGRVGFPCEVAQIILQLAGFMGENMPGEIVMCDGGDRVIGPYL